MTVSKIFRLDKVAFNTNAVEIMHVSQADWSTQIETLTNRGAGEVHPNFRATINQQPQITFSTPELDKILGDLSCGVAGVTFTDCDTYWKEGTATGSTARATTNHKDLSIAEGVLHWTNIRLPNNGQAEIDCVVGATYDGVNAPIVHTGSVALPTHITPGDHFVCGPVAINGTTIDGVQEISISSGVQLQMLSGDGEVYPTFLYVEMTEPQITIRTFDATNWDDLGLTGVALNGSNGATFYARKIAANGQRVANGTAEHISFVVANGRAIPQTSSGQGSSPITDTLLIEPAVTTTATATPIVISDDSTIS